MAYRRATSRRPGRRSPARASRSYGRGVVRSGQRRVRGRRSAAPASRQTLRIVIEQPGATLARPELPATAERRTRKAPF